MRGVWPSRFEGAPRVRELLADAWTVMQKELRELLAARPRTDGRARGSSHGSWWLSAAIVLLLGVVLPLYAGPNWLSHAWLLMLWAWLPVFLVAGIVADSVAGERERHTLETLLASRISDRAILLGKMGAAVLYGWGLMLVTILVSILAINLAYPHDQLQPYRPLLLVGGGLLSLLAAALAASFGTIVSLRAPSVRHAQQTTLLTLASLFLLHAVGVPLLAHLLPTAWRIDIRNLVLAFERAEVVGALAFLLAAANVALLWVAAAWFRRRRLKLD